MLCNIVASLGINGYRLTCQSGGLVVMLADVLLLAALAITVFWILTRPRWLLPGVLGAASVVLLALAIGRPEIVPDHVPTGGLVVAVLDDSDSVRRDELAYSQALESLAASLSSAAESLTHQELQQWYGTTVFFGQAATMGSAIVPLDRLSDIVSVARATPSAPASNAASGLNLALQLIRNQGGAGVIWLLGDGNWDMRALEESLQEARTMGVAVHVMPAGSARAGAGIIAADLAEQQVVGRPAGWQCADSTGPGGSAGSEAGNDIP